MSSKAELEISFLNSLLEWVWESGPKIDPATGVRVDLNEGMGANQLCRIVVGILSQIGRDGHRDMGDVSTYEKIIRNLLGSMLVFGIA